MIYRGNFNDTKNRECELIIKVPDNDPTVVRMDSQNSDIRLLRSPVVITSETDDMFQTIEISAADIGLLTRDYLGGEMFSRNERDVMVNVYHNGNIIFAGYLEPNVYNQPYAHSWDLLSMTANDGLSTLQYRNYLDLMNKDQYAIKKAEIDSVTIEEIFTKMLAPVRHLDILNDHYSNVFYDGSVRLGQNETADSIFAVKLYEALMFGEEFDDLKMYEEVCDDILKYFNLHIKQVGFDYYIYHHSSIGRSITWYPILGSSGLQQAVEPVQIGYYKLVTDSYKIFNNEWRQKLKHTLTGEEIAGNKLTLTLSRTVTYESGEYRRYYYATLPNQSSIKTDKYEVTDVSGDLDYLKKDGDYRILLQGPRGDYNWLTLENAPQSAYSGGTFKNSYYQASANEFITSDN